MKNSEKAPIILVVDDEEHLRWILYKLLSRAGYKVRTVGQGKEALQVCAHEEVMVAIIDYRLPDMNGLQLFQQLSGAGRPMASILITSYGSPKLREEALSVGFRAYLDKPFSHQKLLACLDKITAGTQEK